MGLHLSRGAAFHIHQNVIGTTSERSWIGPNPTVSRRSADGQPTVKAYVTPELSLFLNPFIQYIY